MGQSTIYDWIKGGFTLVPNQLFNNYFALDINSDEMILILFLLSQINQGQSLENISKTAHMLGWSEAKVHEILNTLMNKSLLEIELVENGQGKKTDHYTLRPLFEKLDASYHQTERTRNSPTESDDYSILTVFEEEFGRSLSQMELETLNQWLTQDAYSEDLVKLALKQAVLNGALSLKYIDRILLNWTKKNITTVFQAEQEIARFDNQRSHNNFSTIQPDSRYDHIDIPLDYWRNE